MPSSLPQTLQAFHRHLIVRPKNHMQPSVLSFAIVVFDSPQFEVVWESLRVGSKWKVAGSFSPLWLAGGSARYCNLLLLLSTPPPLARERATLCHSMP